MFSLMATDEELALGQRIARNLQALLRAQGLNQGKLAERSGLSTSNVSNLVNGRKNPSFYSVAKAALALGVDPLELAGFKPLQIPEAPPAVANDRLESLEGRLNRFEEQFRRLTQALGDYADQQAPPKSGDRRRRAG